jgi:heme-degrading monooxygenase HmoA
MVSRHWRGVSHVTEADSYVRYLQHNIFPQFARMAGFASASVLQRRVAAGVEFCVVTTWQSMDAIRQFAGDSPDVAVVPAVVQAMMVEFEKTVAHYEIVDTFTPG